MTELTPVQKFVATFALKGLSGSEISLKTRLAHSTVRNVLAEAYKRDPRLKRKVRLAREEKSLSELFRRAETSIQPPALATA